MDFQKRELFREKAFLVGIGWRRRKRRRLGALQGSEDVTPEESLQELKQLTISAGLRVLGETLELIGDVSPRTFIGSGQCDRLREQVKALGVDVAVFDEELSPSQNRALEEIVDCKVLDRTGLILDIFAQRAKTSEGQLQVELAQLVYLQPRLVGLWKHFGRIKGGIGLRGPGETQLEIDRRRIRERITRVKKSLEKVTRTRDLQRQKRKGVPIPTVCLIGYTNSGKSTLLNALAGSDVGTADLLFATLDPTIRRVKLPNYGDCLVADTVGFIRKLPHQLVDAFKASLEEVVEADALLHVVDMSHSGADAQMKAVRAVIEELEVQDKPVVYVYNKQDVVDEQHRKAFLMEHDEKPVALVSALSKEGLDGLLAELGAMLKTNRRVVTLTIPLSEGGWISKVKARGHVVEEKYEGDCVRMTVELEDKMANQLEKKGFKTR